MLNINNLKWIDIDNKHQEVYIDGIRYVRPSKVESVSHVCPSCNTLICTAEDISSIKKENACEDCYLRFYYTNKEKWEKGWRPTNVNK
jgi:hypothetical protein